MAVNLYPYINLALDPEHLAETPEQEKLVKRKAEARCTEIFGLLDRRLAEEGPYLVGEEFSAADIYLFMLTIWALPSEEALLARCPHIAELAGRVRRRPRLKAALEAHGVLVPGSLAA